MQIDLFNIVNYKKTKFDIILANLSQLAALAEKNFGEGTIAIIDPRIENLGNNIN